MNYSIRVEPKIPDGSVSKWRFPVNYSKEGGRCRLHEECIQVALPGELQHTAAVSIHGGQCIQVALPGELQLCPKDREEGPSVSKWRFPVNYSSFHT